MDRSAIVPTRRPLQALLCLREQPARLVEPFEAAIRPTVARAVSLLHLLREAEAGA